MQGENVQRGQRNRACRGEQVGGWTTCRPKRASSARSPTAGCRCFRPRRCGKASTNIRGPETPCDRCGRSVLTGERVFVCAGQRIICELCIGFESEAPLETRLVHGAELGNSIRVVDKRSRHSAHRLRARARPVGDFGRGYRQRSILANNATPVIPAGRRLPRRGSHHCFRDDLETARGGVRVPGGHRQPLGVHRPLPRRLASHARELLGRGAGARFRIKAPLARFAWGDMTFAEVQPPYRIIEHGRSGKFNRVRMLGTYTLSPGPSGTTVVEYTLETSR